MLALLVFAVELTAGSLGVVGCGEHPNFTAQIPCGNLNNLSGVIPEAIAQEFPQNVFVFSDRWVGYLDPVLPAIQIIWTTRAAAPYIAPEEPERVYGPPIGPPPVVPPIGPPIIHPPINCVVDGNCHPPVECYHDCHPVVPPPVSEVPEPKQGPLVAAGLLALVCLMWPRKHHLR
ncbi:MAG: hypothetical protein RL292_603 [Candidatus Parcubacteria bacterium]|jgi:hypothetical protein